jgi:hypothetical protein
MPRLNHLTVFLFLLAASSLFSCRTVAIRREIRNTGEISALTPDSRYIKAHMLDGTVFILSNWLVDPDKNVLSGQGRHLDINRRAFTSQGEEPHWHHVNIDDIALVETNDPGPSLIGALAVVTGVTAVMAVFCLTNPKACFGSCPTFYANDGDNSVLVAEGFSSSVLPSREKNDIDMLYHASAEKHFELKLTNEAYETHVIRYADLLIVERHQDERIFATPGGRFLRTGLVVSPDSCNASGTNCLEMVSRADGREYFSSTDPEDLLTNETVYLKFRNPGEGSEGLVIGKRQTLLTTYLFYQSIAYMGRSATYWMAEAERGNIHPETLYDLLGGIRVYRKSADNEWIYQGEVDEHGPIATDYNIIPLSPGREEFIELKLIMTKGLWRINYLALATIREETEPVVVRPASVSRLKGSEDEPLARLLDDDDHLVTYPGDIYTITYELPFENAELFLDTRGWYLEWIRDEWLGEQSMRSMRLLKKNPRKFLKKAAREFKQLEPSMEETFWNSRYAEN